MASLGFTRASDQDVFRIEAARPPRSAPAVAITGKEARQFYENLVKDERGDVDKTDKRRRRRTKTTARRESRHGRGGGPANGRLNPEGEGLGVNGVNGERGEGERGDGERRGELQGLRLLRCAHEGDASALKDLLTKGADIDFQDSYLWTGLMCASWAGHRAAVRLLLQRGAAWIGVVDLQGRDARDLALEAGHKGVIEELDSFGRRRTKAESAPCPPRRCDVCGASYSGPPTAHLSSTLHQFNLRRPPPAPHYCLPPSSTCYRMMLRCGWDPGSGLGPEGAGARQPVPTVLKRDTRGLGYGRGRRARVTHFKAMDAQAVRAAAAASGTEQRVGRGVRREEQRRQEQRDQTWERDFRTSFYL